MKIWLDDKRQPPNGGWTWVKTGEEAIEVMKGNNIREISFDHDLGEGMSGYDVAKWIEGMAYSDAIDKILWRVHSDNPVGRKNIETAMNRADSFWDYNDDNDIDDNRMSRRSREDWH